MNKRSSSKNRNAGITSSPISSSPLYLYWEKPKRIAGHARVLAMHDAVVFYGYLFLF